MAKIPIQEDPTLIAVKQYKELERDDPRDYLGASSIGDECARKVWYGHNRQQEFDWQSKLRFDDGHRSEAVMAHLLRGVPDLELWTEDENGNQFGFEDGSFKGHIDGVIRGLLHAPKTTAIWEHKCTEKFNDFRNIKRKHGSKHALENWNEVYYVQAQIYMHYFDLKRHYLTVSSPGCRDFDSAWTEYMPDIAAKYIDRAHKIVDAKEPPPRAYNSETFFKCRMCSFAEECWK